MPRVLVDLFKLRTPHCGLGQYCLHLGRALSRQTSDIETNLLVRDKDRKRLGAVAESFSPPNWRKERVYRWLRPARAVLPSEPAFDLWHATDQSAKHLPTDPRTPVVLTIHDLNFLREKHKIRSERYLAQVQRLVDRSTAVTTISEFVAGEIREHLELNGKPLRVIYNGADPQAADAEATRPDWLAEGPFLFTIGTVLPKKNFAVLVPLMQRVPNLRLVIAGPDHHDYAQTIRDEVARLGLEDRVLLPGSISDAHRQWLYANCEAFVFPSLTEGFGLPVIEAMQHGHPVFCSRRTSLPEVAGPDAFYWESDQPDHLAEVFHAGMQQVAHDTTLDDRLKQNAARFDWDKTAQQYLAFYREVLGMQAERAVRRAA